MSVSAGYTQARAHSACYNASRKPEQIDMPIYEYKCEGCGARFEKLVRGVELAAPCCPSCESPRTVKQLSTFAAHSGASSPSGDMPMCPSGGVCPTPGACGLN